MEQHLNQLVLSRRKHVDLFKLADKALPLLLEKHRAQLAKIHKSGHAVDELTIVVGGLIDAVHEISSSAKAEKALASQKIHRQAGELAIVKGVAEDWFELYHGVNPDPGEEIRQLKRENEQLWRERAAIESARNVAEIHFKAEIDDLQKALVNLFPESRAVGVFRRPNATIQAAMEAQLKTEPTGPETFLKHELTENFKRENTSNASPDPMSPRSQERMNDFTSSLPYHTTGRVRINNAPSPDAIQRNSTSGISPEGARHSPTSETSTEEDNAEYGIEKKNDRDYRRPTGGRKRKTTAASTLRLPNSKVPKIMENAVAPESTNIDNISDATVRLATSRDEAPEVAREQVIRAFGLRRRARTSKPE